MMFSRLKSFSPEVWSWMTYDFANSAFATTITAVIFNKYFAGVIAGGAAGTDFNLLGWRFNLPGATLFALAVLIGTILTIILSPFIGIYADKKGARKRLLVWTIFIGAIATAALSWLEPGNVISGAVLYGVASCAFVLSLNLYNAFLPQICAEKDVGLVSGISWAIGYIGGGLCLLLNLMMLQNPQMLGFAPGTFGVGHVVLSVSAWWVLFSLPIMIGLKERPPSRDAAGAATANLGQLRRSLMTTLKDLRHFRPLWIFLLAYVFFTNGIETSISTASIFGDQELRMDSAALIKLFLLVQFAAFPGALLFGLLVDKIGNKKGLAISLIGWMVALLWVYNLGIFTEPIVEFHLAAVLVGLVMGGSQAAARSLFASFTPPARSAEFFSFYGIAGRVSSIMGPLSFAAVNVATRSLRAAILVMVAFFLAGLIVLTQVDEREGTQHRRLDS
jgi:UMF1 family MFS transporter